MKKYNITTQGTYTKNGVEKKTYPQVGKLIQFDGTPEKEGGFIIELNMFPNTKFYVFEDNKETTEKEVKTIQVEEEPINIQEDNIIDIEDNINPDDIPF